MVRSAKKSKQFDYDYDELFPLCEEAVYRSGFTLKESDELTGHIEAVNSSFGHFNEFITIEVGLDGTVLIQSESPPEIALDMLGLNSQNVTKFFVSLSDLFEEESSYRTIGP